MSSNAKTAQGVKLAMGDTNSPINYTNIAEVMNISGPGGSGQVIDVTDLDSSAREKVMGLPDEGQVTFDINFIADDTQHLALHTARANQTLKPFKLTFTDDSATEWTFNGYVINFTVNNAVDEVTKASITLEVTGAITST